jgi:hypothetical protein
MQVTEVDGWLHLDFDDAEKAAMVAQMTEMIGEVLTHGYDDKPGYNALTFDECMSVMGNMRGHDEYEDALGGWLEAMLEQKARYSTGAAGGGAH